MDRSQSVRRWYDVKKLTPTVPTGQLPHNGYTPARTAPQWTAGMKPVIALEQRDRIIKSHDCVLKAFTGLSPEDQEVEVSRCPFFLSVQNEPSQIFPSLHYMLWPVLIYPQDVERDAEYSTESDRSPR